MGDSSPISLRSSILFGIHSENKAMQNVYKVQRQNRRFTVVAAGALFLLVVALICLVFLNLFTSASAASKQNKTLSLAEQKIEHLGELVKSQQWKLVRDIELEPEVEKSTIEEIPWTEEIKEVNSTENIERWDHLDNAIDEIYIPPNSGTGNEMQEDIERWGTSDLTMEQKFLPTAQELQRWDSVTDAIEQEKIAEEQLKNDSQIAAERFVGVNGPPSEFANHRYSDDSYTQPPGDRSQPRPFSITSESDSQDVNIIQDIIDHPPIIRRPSPIGFTKPLRFKGYYVHPSEAGDRSGRKNIVKNENYYQKINDFFGNESRGKINSQRQEPGVVRGQSSNVHAQVTQPDPYTRAVFRPYTQPEKEPQKEKKQNSKRKPFTVMLDIYPMYQNDEPDAASTSVVPKTPQSAIYIPLRPEASFATNVEGSLPFIPQYMVPPKQRKDRMVMKLNLFPREQTKGQRRTWGLFKKNDNGCSNVIGHNPKGKPISAKWKNKKGEIIHANVVALNQWDDRIDNSIDPR